MTFFDYDTIFGPRENDHCDVIIYIYNMLLVDSVATARLKLNYYSHDCFGLVSHHATAVARTFH
jgi:hypothetical protein